MLSMFLGKKILSGTVCLATATTSIGMTTSCGKNSNSNSVSVSWSKGEYFKVEGKDSVEKLTEYTCAITIDTTKCFFSFDKIKVKVGINPSGDDAKDIWPEIKDLNPNQITNDNIYNLHIPSEYVTDNIYIDLTDAIQTKAAIITVNYDTGPHCTINGSHQGKISENGGNNIKLNLQFDVGYSFKSISGYYANDEKKSNISQKFIFDPDKTNPTVITIPVSLFNIDYDTINVSLQEMTSIEFFWDIETDSDGKPIASVGKPHLFMGVQYEVPVQYVNNDCYYDDSIFVYTNTSSKEKEQGTDITSFCTFSNLDNFKRSIVIDIPLDAIKNSNNSYVYILVKKQTSLLDITKHFPIIFENNTANAHDDQVRTTWLKNVWAENETFDNVPVNDSIKLARKAWAFPLFNVTYQFTPLYEQKILPGDKTESYVQYVLSNDNFDIYYTIVDDKDDKGDFIKHHIENKHLSIIETFEDIGVYEYDPETDDEYIPDELRSYKVTIPNLVSLIPKTDNEIEIASCVISFKLEESKCYGLIDFIGDPDYIKIDSSAYNFINPSSKNDDFTIILTYKDGFTIGDYDLYYVEDNKNISFKNKTTDDGREIVCDFFVRDQKNYVYIIIPIPLIKWNFYLTANYREFSNDSYSITYDMDHNQCSITCLNTSEIKGLSPYGCLVPKGQAKSDFNFEIKIINKVQDPSQSVVLTSWDVLRYDQDQSDNVSIQPRCEIADFDNPNATGTYNLKIPLELITNDIIIKVTTQIVANYKVKITYPEKRETDVLSKIDLEQTKYNEYVSRGSEYVAEFVFKHGYKLRCESIAVVTINNKDVSSQCTFVESSTDNGLHCTTLTIPSGLIINDIVINVDYLELPKINVNFNSVNGHIDLLTDLTKENYYVGDDLVICMVFESGYVFSKFEVTFISETTPDKPEIINNCYFQPGSNTHDNPAKIMLDKQYNTRPGTINISVYVSENDANRKFLGFKNNKITYHDSYYDTDIEIPVTQWSKNEYVLQLPKQYVMFDALNIFANDANNNVIKFEGEFAKGNDFNTRFQYAIFDDDKRTQPVGSDCEIKVANGMSETADMPIIWALRASCYDDIQYLDISPMVDPDIHLTIPLRAWNSISSSHNTPASIEYMTILQPDSSSPSSSDWVGCKYNSTLNTFYWDDDFIKHLGLTNNVVRMKIISRPGDFAAYTINLTKQNSTINSTFSYDEDLMSSPNAIKTMDAGYISSIDNYFNSLCYIFKFDLSIPVSRKSGTHLGLLINIWVKVLGSTCTKCELSDA